MDKPRIVSGIRPTGSLHLGHYLGALQNWVSLQDEYRCLYFIADWHALTTAYKEPSIIGESIDDMVLGWLSCGLDPEKSIIFKQSDVKTHAEFFLLLSMITPVSWLERNPTYKEMREDHKEKDLSTLGFLAYPVLQAADIVIYHADKVPIGEDQLPHLELTREIVRRFNFIYGEGLLKEPQPILTEARRVPGLDGRKMSKSLNNAIFIHDSGQALKEKVMQMLTDIKRMRRKDPGNPKDCNLYPFHDFFKNVDRREEISKGCKDARWGCVDCKKLLISNIEAEMTPIWERMEYYRQHHQQVQNILHEGASKARALSSITLDKVREAMKIT
jgi:tryptophanyl-tRNA synthetase